MKRICPFGLALLVLATLAAYPAVARVAVVDFGIPDDAPGLAWAERGVPDLLTVELARRGWTVLDRESIHLVMAELGLAEQPRAGHLLGASHVLSGRLVLLEEGLIRIDTFLTEVERLETVASVSHAGAYPDDMADLIQAVSESLMQTTVGMIESRPPPGSWFPRPEAMIFFHRGLAAYTEGYPDAAVAWFLAARAIEPRLLAASAWTARALEAAGLPDLAEALRKELESASRSGGGAEPDPNQRGTLALAQPLLLPAEGWSEQERIHVWETLQNALRVWGPTSLIVSDGLHQAIREQDHQLSGLFTQASMARYGQWQIPDGLLQFRIDRDGASLRLRAWIDDTLTGTTVAHEEIRMQWDEIAAGIPRLVQHTLTRWEEQQDRATAERVQWPVRSIPPHILQGLPSGKRAVAESLSKTREGSATAQSWQKVAEVFLDMNLYSLTELSITYMLEAIQDEDPNVDRSLYQAWRWLSHFMGLARWVEPMHTAASRALEPVETRLQNLAPRSLYTGQVWLEKGEVAWYRGEFKDAVAYASEALSIFEAEPAGEGHRRLPKALYLKGSSLAVLGRKQEALAALHKTNQYLDRYPDVAKQMWFDIGWGQFEDWNQRLLVEDTIRTIVAGECPSESLLYRIGAFQRRTNLRFDAELRDLLIDVFDNLTEAWRTRGPFYAQYSDLGMAANWLQMSKHVCDEEEQRAFLLELLAAYPDRVRQTADHVPEDPLFFDWTPHAASIFMLFVRADLRADGLAFLDECIEAADPPERGLEVLSVVDLNASELAPRLYRLSQRLADGEKGVPGHLWTRLADHYAAEREWEKATAAARNALASSEPAEPDAGLARVLIHLGFDRQPSAPLEAVRDLCEEFGILPWMPRLSHWYREAREAARHADHERAVACFQVVLRFIEARDQMHPTIAAASYGTEGSSPIQIQDPDEMWLGDHMYEGAKLSVRFDLALSLLLVNRPDEAASLFREVALVLGHEPATWWLEIDANSGGGVGTRLGELSSRILHSLHLLQEAQKEEAPNRVRRRARNELYALSREFLRYERNSSDPFGHPGYARFFAETARLLRQEPVAPDAPEER